MVVRKEASPKYHGQIHKTGIVSAENVCMSQGLFVKWPFCGGEEGGEPEILITLVERMSQSFIKRQYVELRKEVSPKYCLKTSAFLG